jgi:hypothetical protein
VEDSSLVHNRTSKRDRLLRKALGRHYTFDASQGDLEVLRTLLAGTCGASKPGDPSFHAYAAAVNVANEFASQALDILELILFQAFVGYTGNMVLVTGVPDDPGSLPHSHPKHKL